MTIYTFPSSLWALSSLSFTLRSNSSASPQSPFNPYRFTQAPTSDFWQVIATVDVQTSEQWRPMSALLHKLRGMSNTVRLFDPSRELQGAGAVGPTINVEVAAAAGATTLQVNGLIASQAVSLAADDLLGIGENLYSVLDDAASDADGKATLNILPPLRQGVAYGDPVNLLNPTGLFQLVPEGDALTIVAPTLSHPLQLRFGENPDFG